MARVMFKDHSHAPPYDSVSSMIKLYSDSGTDSGTDSGAHLRKPRSVVAAARLVLAMMMISGGAAWAAEDQRLLYQARFLGLPVGNVAIRVSQTETTYDVTVNGRATGLFWTLRGIRVHRAASGRIADDGTLEPTRYRRAHREWDKQAEYRIDYAQPDGIPRGFKNGQPVNRMEPALRADTVDPLSALFRLHQRVAALAVAGDGASVDLVQAVYDGKLRYDVHIRLAAPETVTAAGQSWRARAATVTFEPLGGFSEKHAAEYRAGGLHILFSDHALAIPLRLEADQGWGVFDLVFVGRCGAVETPCPDNEVDPLESTEYTNGH